MFSATCSDKGPGKEPKEPAEGREEFGHDTSLEWTFKPRNPEDSLCGGTKKRAGVAAKVPKEELAKQPNGSQAVAR